MAHCIASKNSTTLGRGCWGGLLLPGSGSRVTITIFASEANQASEMSRKFRKASLGNVTPPMKLPSTFFTE